MVPVVCLFNHLCCRLLLSLKRLTVSYNAGGKVTEPCGPSVSREQGRIERGKSKEQLVLA